MEGVQRLPKLRKKEGSGIHSSWVEGHSLPCRDPRFWSGLPALPPPLLGLACPSSLAGWPRSLFGKNCINPGLPQVFCPRTVSSQPSWNFLFFLLLGFTTASLYCPVPCTTNCFSHTLFGLWTPFPTASSGTTCTTNQTGAGTFPVLYFQRWEFTKCPPFPGIVLRVYTHDPISQTGWQWKIGNLWVCPPTLLYVDKDFLYPVLLKIVRRGAGHGSACL